MKDVKNNRPSKDYMTIHECAKYVGIKVDRMRKVCARNNLGKYVNGVYFIHKITVRELRKEYKEMKSHYKKSDFMNKTKLGQSVVERYINKLRNEGKVKAVNFDNFTSRYCYYPPKDTAIILEELEKYKKDNIQKEEGSNKKGRRQRGRRDYRITNLQIGKKYTVHSLVDGKIDSTVYKGKLVGEYKHHLLFEKIVNGNKFRESFANNVMLYRVV
ncbi:hypothetical protein [Peptostreptococcus faecalis]|uniref:hypothetical protein n=1 Tax=Peptostreptococcus faecalis TaxID=2045015 RepID=UPI0011AF4360|nr:hypothetical protein [Peptostreptococcus faecalis]